MNLASIVAAAGRETQKRYPRRGKGPVHETVATLAIATAMTAIVEFDRDEDASAAWRA